MDKFDLIVIGAGPGGYVAAIKAAQFGLKVACVEKRKTLGGVCLNIGCIPSKALLHHSHQYEMANKHFADYGIEFEKLKLNLDKLQQQRKNVVDGLTKGIDFLFNKNKVTKIQGHAKFLTSNEIEVENESGKIKYQADKFIIATGSVSANLPGIDIDEQYICSSTGALEFSSVPENLAVIGGGYIGLELGSVWRRLGSKVTVIEFFDRIVPAMDQEIGQQFHKILESQGLAFKLKHKVISAKVENNKVNLLVENLQDNKQVNLVFDKVLVSIGRRPNTENLGLEQIGVTIEKGMINVNDKLQTTCPNIYAIGDVIKGPMLAHKAEEEAVAAVENIVGQYGHVNYNAIPAVVYTHPEVASVGKTEEQLKQEQIEYKVGKFPFKANSRARCVDENEGLVKILACKKTDTILGAHIIGPDAGTMIAEFVIAIEYAATSEDIARICHAHPTLNEAIKEAALATFFKPIHI